MPTLGDWGLVTCIAAPHVLYAFIWFFPQKWMAAFPKHPVQAFDRTAWLGKGIQFASVIAWFRANLTQPISWTTIHPLQWLVCLVLVGFGQALNLGIYKAIGSKGVYYGFKLGEKVPWHTGFPFNVVSHPQYVGSAMTVWGLALLVWQQAPLGLGAIAVLWTALYVITALQEQFL